jgi:hypothetical protein
VPAEDILVNNLGIFEPKPFTEIGDNDWLRFFEVNVLSGARLSRFYLPGMIRRNWGRIVFISSESGINIPVKMIHYGVTKTAQIALARGLAETTAGTNVTVNSVLPGPTRSEGVEQFVEDLAKGQGTDAAKDIRGRERKGPAFLFDLDGTLVDSVYQHVLAWREALEAAGIELSVWRIHRRIGMSGGLLANALLRETGCPLSAEETARLHDCMPKPMCPGRVLFQQFEGKGVRAFSMVPTPLSPAVLQRTASSRQNDCLRLLGVERLRSIDRLPLCQGCARYG